MICITLISLHSLANAFINAVFIVKFYVWVPNMPCALDKRNNGRFKREHVESSSITNHIHPLPQYIWPLNFAMWWPSNHMVFWDHITIMWETKSNSLYCQCLWQPNLAKWWLILSASYLRSQIAFKACGLLRSHDKLRVYLHYHQCLWQSNLAGWGLTMSCHP